jgi:RraA family protein
MAYLKAAVNFPALADDLIARWRTIPTATISDLQNRGNAMAGAIKPIDRGMRICGQARTVKCMHADNSMVHYMCSTARPGEVLVVDSGGLIDVAIWGGYTSREAKLRGLGGMVVDGAVRDVSELSEVGFPVFAKGYVPRGPHKAFGGTVDIPVNCGGVVVRPGDLIVGDDDGVAIVPLEIAESLIDKAIEHEGREEEWTRALHGDVPFYQVLNIPSPEPL